MTVARCSVPRQPRRCVRSRSAVCSRMVAPSSVHQRDEAGKAGGDRRAVVDARPARAPPAPAPGRPWRCGGRSGCATSPPPGGGPPSPSHLDPVVTGGDRDTAGLEAAGDRLEPVALLDPQLGQPLHPRRARGRRPRPPPESETRRSSTAPARPAPSTPRSGAASTQQVGDRLAAVRRAGRAR